jgi:hypothetical protein
MPLNQMSPTTRFFESRLNNYSSNVFSPGDISGLIVWLKADALVLSDNDAITTWTDSSGQSNNATQGTGAAKPTYKTNIQNGKPVARFDGGDFLDITTTGFANSAFTVFVAMSYSSGSFPAFFAEISGGSNGYVALGGDNANQMAISKTGIATSSSNLSIGSFAQFCYKSAGISGGNITVTPYKNGTQGSGDLSLTSVATNTNTEIGASKGGSADFLVGDIAEIIYYNSQLSDVNRQSVESYLTTKYGL